jgi:hypothetical protein
MDKLRYRPTHLKDVFDAQGRRVPWLTKRAGISRSYAYSLLNAEQTCDEAVASRIAAALEVPTHLIFRSSTEDEMASRASQEQVA